MEKERSKLKKIVMVPPTPPPPNNCELFVLKEKSFVFLLLIRVDDWKKSHTLHICFLNILYFGQAFSLVQQASVELQLHAMGVHWHCGHRDASCGTQISSLVALVEEAE